MRIPMQEEKSLEAIRDFLKANDFCYLSVVDGDTPYTVPLNFGYMLEESGALTLYFHTSSGGRLHDVIKRGPERKAKACFAVAVMEGVLRFEQACDWDLVYQSMMGEGDLETLSEEDDKRHALSVLMDSMGAAPGYSFTSARVKAVTVYKVTVRDYHMKKSKKGREHLQK